MRKYPLFSSQVAIALSCRCSWALRMIGFATAPHSRSATIVAARYRSCSEGSSPRSSQTKMSLSAMSSMTAETLSRARRAKGIDILAGSFPSFSMTLTKFAGTPASPIRRSTASGGQVAIRKVDRTLGLDPSRDAPMSVRFLVAARVASTSLVVCMRVVR